METDEFFTIKEKDLLFSLYRKLLQLSGETLQKGDCKKLKTHLVNTIQNNRIQRDIFGLNPVIKDMQTAVIVAEEIGMKRASILGLMLHDSVRCGTCTALEVEQIYGEDVAGIIRGLIRVNELYSKSPTIESENFRNLLLTFAEDMRVILIMIADRVNIMRQIKDCKNDEARRQVANEAAYLYAPLAHKLGLYKLKSELEDLSLKYTEKEVYYHIKEKLNETKASRDKYIAAFIAPVQKKLEEAGLKFHIKGRTKSIHSIYQKMKKQKCPFEGVYDLFAIRVILDSCLEKEKLECWQAYSIVTDMYQPNPKRLRDWLSVPKSNGYESLHITVMGPEGKWVEVQIRTERMDDIAERGLAAHWRYKGVKGESGLDEWLTSVREALESSDSNGLETMDQFKLDLYEDEVFVFTPKGDLFKLAKGSTVLDSGCKGLIRSVGGLYEGMMDDAINVHGTYLKVQKRIDNKTLVGEYMHGQSYGFEWGRPGDVVQFIESKTMEVLGEQNKVAAIEAADKPDGHGAKQFRITFEKPVDPAISEVGTYGIENLEWTPEVYFADNVIRNNRARGSLFSTPKKTVVEKNVFDHTSGTAILLCGDCNGWFETGACHDVHIRNNKFINALTNQFQFTNAVISIYPEIPDLKSQKRYFHSGIVIEDNEFETFDMPILYAKSVDGLVFRNNVIRQNHDYPAFHWNNHRFFFQRVVNVEIKDNRFDGGFDEEKDIRSEE